MLVSRPGRIAGKRLRTPQPTLNDYTSIFWSLEMPICKHSVRKLHSAAKFLKHLSEKFLTFVNPVLSARVEHTRDYRRGGSRRREPKTIPTRPTPPRAF